MDTFEDSTSKFWNWLINDANVKCSPKIEIRDYRATNEGRCLVAKDSIKNEETLFEIPYSTLLNIENSKLLKDYDNVSENLISLGHWEGLILSILYEVKVVGTTSKWRPYIDVFPSKTSINSLIYWGDKQLQKLQPSLVLTRIGKDSAKTMFESLKQFLNDNKIELDIDWSDYLWAASVIMSYSFDVERGANDDDEENEESDEEKPSLKSMIPLADILNSDTHKCNAHLMYGMDSLKMVAIDNIDANAQIYNIYGEHPNAEILRRYGYVEYGGSKYDFGEVTITNVKSVLLEHFKIGEEQLKEIFDVLSENEIINEYLEGEDIILDSYDCYIDGEISINAVILLQIVSAYLSIDNEGTAINRQLERITKKCTQLVGSGRVTDSVNTLWKKIIESRKEEYPVIDSQNDVTKESDISLNELRSKMANEVLRNELNSLKCCEDSISKNFKTIPDKKLLDNIIKRKSDDKDNTSGSSSKKRKN